MSSATSPTQRTPPIPRGAGSPSRGRSRAASANGGPSSVSFSAGGSERCALQLVRLEVDLAAGEATVQDLLGSLLARLRRTLTHLTARQQPAHRPHDQSDQHEPEHDHPDHAAHAHAAPARVSPTHHRRTSRSSVPRGNSMTRAFQRLISITPRRRKKPPKAPSGDAGGGG